MTPTFTLRMRKREKSAGKIGDRDTDQSALAACGSVKDSTPAISQGVLDESELGAGVT